MVKKYETINVDKKIKKLLTNECVEEYLKHHPEMEGINITQSKMLYELIKYYLPKKTMDGVNIDG